MTNKEILAKAIDKAISNGYKPRYTPFRDQMNGDNLTKYLPYYELYVIIFSHDFAKSFWAEEELQTCCGPINMWQEKLQSMVIKEDPIQYLKLFI